MLTREIFDWIVKEAEGINTDDPDELENGLRRIRDKALEGIASTNNTISLVWSIADVLTVRPDLTDDQAYDVLKDVEHHHDASIGVTWDTLEYAALHICGDSPFVNDNERDAYAEYCADQRESGKHTLDVSSWRETNG